MQNTKVLEEYFRKFEVKLIVLQKAQGFDDMQSVKPKITHLKAKKKPKKTPRPYSEN